MVDISYQTVPADCTTPQPIASLELSVVVLLALILQLINSLRAGILLATSKRFSKSLDIPMTQISLV